MSSATPPPVPPKPPPGPAGPRNNWVRVGSAAAARLTVESQEKPGNPGTLVVRAVGEAELPPETDLFQQSLTRLCGGKPGLIVLDLGALRFASSLALGAMTSTRRSLAAHGGKLVLVAPTRPVRDVLSRTGLTALFPIFPTVDAALIGGAVPPAGKK